MSFYIFLFPLDDSLTPAHILHLYICNLSRKLANILLHDYLSTRDNTLTLAYAATDWRPAIKGFDLLSNYH